VQEGPNSKQQIVDQIKQSTNILVTVGVNPSVDALAAALGLTLMLIKLDKHATAVFSGVVPPAISFLEPGKTFENNVDSLRDFIIALDKEKADRLRYKVENDVVRVFITPYRTRITEKDLQFSQGDFNVDLIVALGVENQKDLDQAIAAHGRILHDATVVTINAGSQKSSLGSIDWQDSNASSLSEMLASMAESLKTGILDQQISTAMLTGIVSSTERFSNRRTTPRVMTISAQLMAAGANQQLIASKLQTIPAPVSPRREKPKQDNSSQSGKKPSDANGEMLIEHKASTNAASASSGPAQLPRQQQPKPKAKPQSVPGSVEPELPVTPPAAQTFNDLKEAIQEETAQTAKRGREMVTEPPAPGGGKNTNGPGQDDSHTTKEKDTYLSERPSWQGRDIQPPTMGGSLSATAEQALEDKRYEQEEKRNRTILTHGAAESAAANDTLDLSKTPLSPDIAPINPEPIVAQPMAERLTVEPAPEPVASQEPVSPGQPIVPSSELPDVEPVVSNDIPVAPPLVISEPVTPVPELQPQLQAPALPTVPHTPEPVSLAPKPVASEPSLPQPVEPTIEDLAREAASHAVQSTAPQAPAELGVSNEQVIPEQPNVLPAVALPAQPAPAPLEMPPLPPMPDFGTLPPVPGAAPAPDLSSPPLDNLAPNPPVEPPQPPAPMPPSTPTDPSQFRIPTQS
jgi:nanoRNase/pAp phosphatase (c-di-AMP/oligoRNAs hydrolase)